MRARYQSFFMAQPTSRKATAMTVSWPSSTPTLKPTSADT